MTKTTITLIALLFMIPLQAQTKKLKRPRGSVGISSVDRFVRESFDLYEKVYMYDGYAAAGKSLEDEDIDVLEDALTDLEGLSTSTPDIVSDLDGVGALKQGKSILRINRAKKALKYSIKTAKKLLAGQRERDTESSPSDDSSSSDNSGDNSSSNEDGSTSSRSSSDGSSETTEAQPVPLEIYSKFDYVPGDKLLFFDDYADDFIGDFPSKWNTNGSGEVVTTNKTDGKWFQLVGSYGTLFIPDAPDFPEDYTIEFDILSDGLGRQTSSSARLRVFLDDNTTFREGDNNFDFAIPFCQYTPVGITVNNEIKSSTVISNTVTADIRKAIINQPHISVAVNKQRFRLWVNEKKYVDIPRLVPAAQVMKAIKFNVYGFKDGKERVFIRNLKIAQGGVDLRRTLISKGKVSTNGILFDSGSATIQPQSLGIIRQISQVLQQEKDMRLNIIGHTDSDGNDATNLKLSQDRALSVKNALSSIYGIDSSRLTTEGKGNTVPIGDNNTVNGKAQNRRVDFVKI